MRVPLFVETQDFDGPKTFEVASTGSPIPDF